MFGIHHSQSMQIESEVNEAWKKSSTSPVQFNPSLLGLPNNHTRHSSLLSIWTRALGV